MARSLSLYPPPNNTAPPAQCDLSHMNALLYSMLPSVVQMRECLVLSQPKSAQRSNCSANGEGLGLGLGLMLVCHLDIR